MTTAPSPAPKNRSTASLAEALSQIGFVWAFFSAYRLRMVVIILLSLSYSLLEGAGIAALLPIIEAILGHQGSPSLISSTVNRVFQAFGRPFRVEDGLLIMLLLFVLKSCIELVVTFFTAKSAERLRTEMMSDIFKKFAGADLDYLMSHRVGGLLDVIFNQTLRVQLFFKGLVTQLTHLIYTLALVALAFSVSVELTLLSLLFILILGAIMFKVIPKFRRLGQKIGSSDRALWNLVTQYVIGFKTIKAYNAFDPACLTVAERVRDRGRIQLRVNLIDGGLGILIELLFLALLLLFIYLPLSFGWNLAKAGVVTAFMLRVSQRAKLLRGIASLGEFLPALGTIDKVQREFESHQPDGRRSGLTPRFEDAIRLSNLSFSYRSGPRRQLPVLRDISFELRNGEMIGIVGPSGAGKSTLAALLLGLLEPSEGTIEVDGVSLRSVHLPAWRQLIGYVPQEGFLLNASVSENIVFLRDGIDQTDVERAARQANIHEFICSLPSGYHTPVGENGVALSAGERQRVCLARALAGRPQILILDEATSSLDSHVEKLILEAIRQLRQSRPITIVVIAHRLSTIEEADRIIVLDKGRLVEMGTKPELLLRPEGVFRALYAIQNPNLTVVDLEAL